MKQLRERETITASARAKNVKPVSVWRPDECGEIWLRQGDNGVSFYKDDYFKLGSTLARIILEDEFLVLESRKNDVFWTLLPQPQIKIDGQQARKIHGFLVEAFS